MIFIPVYFLVFFFNDTATTEIYTLSLHDALPISAEAVARQLQLEVVAGALDLHVPALQADLAVPDVGVDRKSTRLNSSHDQISYAVFCLKKKKKKKKHNLQRNSTSRQ